MEGKRPAGGNAYPGVPCLVKDKPKRREKRSPLGGALLQRWGKGTDAAKAWNVKREIPTTQIPAFLALPALSKDFKTTQVRILSYYGSQTALERAGAPYLLPEQCMGL